MLILSTILLNGTSALSISIITGRATQQRECTTNNDCFSKPECRAATCIQCPGCPEPNYINLCICTNNICKATLAITPTTLNCGCGDNVCNPAYENSNSCPQDCPVSPAIIDKKKAAQIDDVEKITCRDGTPYNRCSNIKPSFCKDGNLIDNCELCGCNEGNLCQNKKCVPDAPEINNKPILTKLPDIILNEDQNNLNNILNLNDYAIDYDNDVLTFSFNNNINFNSDIIDCNIDNNFINCNTPKGIGETSVTILVSDNIESVTGNLKFTVNAKVIKNTAPIAVAGEDLIINPNQEIILDASNSYDLENNIPNTKFAYNEIPTFLWYEIINKELKLIGEEEKIKVSFQSGVHEILLKVTDTSGITGEDTLKIIVTERDNCKSTAAKYYPKDTICNEAWPTKEGVEIDINNKADSCEIFEVCSSEIDHVVEDAINCCDGTPLQDPNKFKACSFANEFSDNNLKCQALYLIQSFGNEAIYMQGWFETEMCCSAVKGLCSRQEYFFRAEPPLKNKPNIGSSQLTLLTGLNCEYDYKKDIFSRAISSITTKPIRKPLIGWWKSDGDVAENNIALFDAPAHVSINKLKTGTCVDYSSALTTVLRKASYKKDEVFTVAYRDHAANLIKFKGDDKFTIVDTTGNNYGISINNVPKGYDYCGKNKRCYNDNGEVTCPSLSEIFGCENSINVKEKFNEVRGRLL